MANGGNVDIVFLIDATGSMKASIDAVKESIRAFISELTHQDANGGRLVSNWRAAIVGYRDVQDAPENWLQANPFVGTEADLEMQLQNLEATGGGDEPESLLEALYCVVNWQQLEQSANGAQSLTADGWRSAKDARRCVVVLTDATFRQEFSTSDGRLVTMDDVNQLIFQQRVIIAGAYPAVLQDSFDGLCSVPGSYLFACKSDPANPDSAQAALAYHVNDREMFKELMVKLAASISKRASQNAVVDL